MTKKKGETLESLKEEAESYFKEKDYDKALEICSNISASYPKNSYGYLGIIKSKTHDYTIYLSDDKLKEIKSLYSKLSSLLKKEEKKNEEYKYNEYINDCKEVENLKKIRKTITGKFFIKKCFSNKVMGLNKEINDIKKSKQNGKKISDIYDFAHGLFFVLCLVFNLIYRNYLLVLTVPFGIFGVITMYKFFDDNFIRNKVYAIKKHKVMIEKLTNEIKAVRQERSVVNKSIDFLNDQKITIISKIPASFLISLEELTNNNEKNIARHIFNNITDREVLKELLETNTDLNIEDYLKEDSDIKIINISLEDKKNEKNNKLIYMKKLGVASAIITVLLLFVSIASSIILYNNFYELNGKAFVFGLITGIGSLLIYNINTGKSKSLTDTFNDNLLSTIFNATLIYDLIYASITKDLTITYGFIEVPLIFLFILIGYVMLISLFKYSHLIKKLRRQ